MEISNYIILTDQQLVTLAHDGDAVAFETLFNRYRDGIYKLYLNRTGGNRDDADDLLQETFIKVFLNLGKYDTAFTFGQWIYTIARNTFIDFMRKRRDDLQIDTSPEGGDLWVGRPRRSFRGGGCIEGGTCVRPAVARTENSAGVLTECRSPR